MLDSVEKAAFVLGQVGYILQICCAKFFVAKCSCWVWLLLNVVNLEC